MSSRNVKKFKRVYKIASSSWSTGTLTVNTIGSHYLTTGDVVYLIFNNTPQNITGAVTVASATQFTMDVGYDYGVNGGEVHIESFGTSLAATTVNSGILNSILTNTKSAYGDTVVQLVLAASGNGAIKMQGSLDGTNFVDISGATISITGGTTGATTIAPRWLFIRPVVTTTFTQPGTILMTV